MDRVPWLSPYRFEFPPVENALVDPNGLLAAGGDLSPRRLELAYRSGIFPWYDDPPILWWAPDPRAVLFPDKLHMSRSLRRVVRSGRYRVTFDQRFRQVIQHCAGWRPYARGTWITPEMERAYVHLHALGLAHSVECWEDETLVGGLYGIAIGRLFFGESMYSHRTDASKVALVQLVEWLTEWGYALIDCQLPNDHLRSLGAEEIPRSRFQEYLDEYLDYAGAIAAGWTSRSG